MPGVWILCSLCLQGADIGGRWAMHPHDAAEDDHADGDQLSERHGSAEDRAAAGIITIELEGEARNSVEECVCAEDLAGELFVLPDPEQQREEREFGREFVELRGVQRDIQW